MKEGGTPQKKSTAEREKEILNFWRENNIFKKSLAKKSPKGEFVFYDGPPFATGLPHYGHVLAGTIKDVIPRYRTMRGYHVRRRWGWDCHGLPLENEVERELGLTTKRDILEYGIGEFNKKAREAVMRYADDWREIIPRTGRWVDMERDYRTMDWEYTESVWWVFKTLYEKELLYEGFKPMHLCPRCETTLSNFEVSQGYKDTTDIAVTVSLPLVGEENTSLLAWTTTAWTLPGNLAAAVNPNIMYAKYRVPSTSRSSEKFIILAKERAKDVLKDKKYEVVEEFLGGKLVGKAYEPPFAYYKDAPLKNKENAWKVYAADFVTTNEGTGIVHIAPAFGEDDQLLAEKYSIPLLHHVGTDGRFKKEVTDFAGMFVKPKGNPEETDSKILKNLMERGLVFSHEKITHSYPFCWRCDTPLLNYAATSWFVKVTKIKDELVKANKKINWVPQDIKNGRFGNWLLGARDWAISRSRFWGAPIPAWKCTKCDHVEIIGSFDELKKKSVASGNGNTFFIMRHGEARSNVEGIMSSKLNAKNSLTEKGKKDLRKPAKFLKNKKIDLIFTSPLERTKETAVIMAGELGMKENKVLTDVRLREIDVGAFEGKSVNEWAHYFSSFEERFTKKSPDGENFLDAKRRMTEFLYEIDEKYSGKTILIVSHEGPLMMLSAGAKGLSNSQMLKTHDKKKSFIRTSGVRKLDFAPLPHDENFTLDLHRPHIDEVKFGCPCGGKMKRIPDVFDCWFESGSMPYGERHYPFENTDVFEPKKKRGFPADFIAEGLDQTRGWFYSLLVLGVALFGERAYKNVVVNGLILADDGRKMSKQLKNYPELTDVLDRYGADALRLYLLSTPVVRADDIRFSEDGVKEAQNKIVSRLRNAVSFYKIYTKEDATTKTTQSNHVLDIWIRVRLTELVNKVTDALERYEIDKAVRPIQIFVDDFSTWYIRRSRPRFKGEDLRDRENAETTMQYVLRELAKTVAPFAPFVAEEVYSASGGNAESVHLESWPKYESRFPVWPNPMALFHRIFGTHSDIKILEDMAEVRRIVSLALEARASAGIKVRQPLAALTVRGEKTKIAGNEDLLDLIRGEVNVKEVKFANEIKNEVEIDTNITPELREEGAFRELLRAVQDLRKKEDLNPGDSAVLLVKANAKGRQFIEKFEDELKSATTLEKIEFRDEIEGEEIVVDDFRFVLNLTPNT